MKVIINFVSKASEMGKKFRILFFATTCILLVSCEDPGLLNGDKNFTRSSLRTVYVDTFSIKTSTILIDSLPTSGNGVLLVGNYQDAYLGKVSASTYFQIGYASKFAPDQSSSFDSIGLILSYDKYFYGDTTKSQNIRVHQLTSIPRVRIPLPYRNEENISFFVAASQPGLYNSSLVNFNPTPISSVNIKFYPHRDSLYLRISNTFGQNWFDLAKADAISSSTSYFNNTNLFASEFFNGIHITSDGSSNASIVGFKAIKARVRLYYKQLDGDILKQKYFDFQLGNTGVQYNQISADRSGTSLASLLRRQAIPSSSTGNVTYIQSGVGIATKVEFPSFKSFFSNKNFVLIDAALEITPIQNTYSARLQAPSTLSLYLTDQSNVISNKALAFDRSGYLSADIAYDYEFGINTKYSFPMVNYLSSELISESSFITPLVIAASPPEILTEVNRVVIGDQSNSQHRIKLKVHYSYVPNQ